LAQGFLTNGGHPDKDRHGHGGSRGSGHADNQA
jgi:hypothetical protein